MLKTQLLTENQHDLAAILLAKGEVVAFPTETVYGLGADATNSEAVLKIYAAKGRPRFNPLIAHVESLDAAIELGHFNEEALTLASLWAGAITLVVPLKSKYISEIALAGLNSIAIRVPNNATALNLLCAFKKPIVAPSANRSGHISPTQFSHVYDDLNGRIAAILQGEVSEIGVESTIVSCLNKPVILREGGVPRETIEALIGKTESVTSKTIIAPGMMLAHYAPNNKLRLNALSVEKGECLLNFGVNALHAPHSLNLSPIGNLSEAAQNLFSFLRQLDKLNQPICVAPIPQKGLGVAINDRLKRAAH